jgi:hypothetical protein
MPGLGKVTSNPDKSVDESDEDSEEEQEDRIVFDETSQQSLSQQRLFNHGGDINKAVVLLDEMLPPEMEDALKSTFDHLCPALKSSKKLEDKVLRVIFSIGVDVVVADAALSSFLDKLSLKPVDLITSNDTDDIFSRFHIPSNIFDQENEHLG